MKICILWKNDYPWDVRIEKFARCLKDAGHEVYLLCSNKKKKARKETLAGIDICRLPFTNSNLANNLISLPFYFNPYWFYMAYKTVKKEKIDIIIVRDLPLVLIGLALKKMLGVPVILDMAENYPAMYRNRIRKGGLTALRNLIIKNPNVAEYVEKIGTTKADHVVVVVEESAERLLAQGVKAHKISIVSNTPDLALFEKNELWQINNRNYLQMIYVGFVQEGRGLDTAIKALEKINKSGYFLKLVIIGDGDYLPTLKKNAKELDVENLVDFKGWMKSHDIPQHIFTSDIGIIPHKKTEHTDTTIPNKLFDFMACGKPVIVTNANPMKRIVEQEQCGVVFNSEDIEDFERAVMRFLKNPDMISNLGTNGKNAIANKYNWAIDSSVLIDVITGITK